MEEVRQNIKKIIEELQFKIEKIENNTIYASRDDNSKLIISIGNRKIRPIIENNSLSSKIVIISPYLLPKITTDILEEILTNTEEKIIFLNKKSFNKLYPHDLIKVINYLKENPGSYIKKISEDLNIHPEKVRRIILKLSNSVEIKRIQNRKLPKLPHIITLKREIDSQEIKEILSKKIEIHPKKRKRKRSQKYIKISKEEALPLIVKFLEENPGTYVREISRKLKINPAIVHYCLKEISEFIEVITPSEIFSMNLPNLPLQIKIKNGYTSEGILRILRIKKILENKKF